MSAVYDEGERINEEQARQREKDQDEFAELLRTKSGRKFIYQTFNESYIFSTTFTKSSEGFFNEGKRALALKWFNAILDIDPHIFSQMCIEFRNKEE